MKNSFPGSLWASSRILKKSNNSTNSIKSNNLNFIF